MLPSRMPEAEKTKVIEPMSATAGTMRVPGRNANVMPTGERVDARCDRQQEHGLKRQRAVELILVLGQRLADHVAADDAQQHERDPVIDGGDKLLKLRAEQIAQQRHERLKTAEPRPGDAAFLP